MSKLEEILARANAAGQNAKNQSLKDFPGDEEKAGKYFQSSRAAYLESSLQRYIENGERTKLAQQPACTPGWELMEAWLGPHGTGKKVWIEYQTFHDDGDTFANLYHCHIPGPTGCAKVLIGEDSPFSVWQIKSWEAQAVAADSHDEHNAPAKLPTTCSYSASLATDAYQRTLDAQHHANRRAA